VLGVSRVHIWVWKQITRVEGFVIFVSLSLNITLILFKENKDLFFLSFLSRHLLSYNNRTLAFEEGLQRRKYSVIQKDGLNFVSLYFLNYTWYVNDLHNI